MNDESGPLVFWILAPIFVAVGLYLIWYARRRKKMLEEFAKMRQLSIRPEYEKKLEDTLNNCFSLKDEGLVRCFGQLSSILDGGTIWIFRSVELLDLNPYAQSYATHFSRVVALFEVSKNHDEFFILNKSMQVIKRLAKTNSPNHSVTDTVKGIVTSCHGRHALSVTFAKGHGLIYFEPTVTGGETIDDIVSLYCIAKKLSRALSSDV